MTAAARTGVTLYETPSDTEIRITRVMDAPQRVVFEAWTNPKHIPRWMTGLEGWTMPVCEIDARNGGRWRYVWRKSDGAEMEMSGIVREIVPPSKMVTTERWGPEWPETVNTLMLSEADGQTTITLTVAYPSKEARDAALKTGMKDGMDETFARLDAMLSKTGL